MHALMRTLLTLVEEVALSQENVSETRRTERQVAREAGIRKSSVLNIRTVHIDTVLEILIFWG